MLITHGLVVCMTEPNRVIEDGALLIRDGLIADIGPTLELLARYSDPRLPDHETDVLDAGGKLVLPGNICAHTHFYGAFARGMAIPGQPAADFEQILQQLWWKLDRALDLDGARYSALVCLANAIRHGTTTLIDHHASPNAIDGSLSVIRQAVAQAGLRAALCYEVTDRNGTAGAQAGIRENVRFAQEIRRQPSELIRAAFGLHALLTVGDDTLDESVEAARHTWHTAAPACRGRSGRSNTFT